MYDQSADIRQCTLQKIEDQEYFFRVNFIYEPLLCALPTAAQWKMSDDPITQLLFENVLHVAEQQFFEKEKIKGELIAWTSLDPTIQNEHERVSFMLNTSQISTQGYSREITLRALPHEQGAETFNCPVGIALSNSLTPDHLPFPSMHDQHCVKKIQYSEADNLQTGQLFGLFDGYMDDTASKHARYSLALTLRFELEQNKDELVRDRRIANALQATYEQIHATYRGTGRTTATVVFSTENDIFVAQAGDSRALFVMANGMPIQASIDSHTSAIGHRDQPTMSASPTLTKYSLFDMVNGYCVLASSLFWKLFTSNQVGAQIKKMAEAGYSTRDMAAVLLATAARHGAIEDLTIMVVKLPSHPVLLQSNLDPFPSLHDAEDTSLTPEEWAEFDEKGLPERVWDVIERAIRVKWRKCLVAYYKKDNARYLMNRIFYKKINKKNCPKTEEYFSRQTASSSKERNLQVCNALINEFKATGYWKKPFHRLKDWQWDNLCSNHVVSIMKGNNNNLIKTIKIINTLIYKYRYGNDWLNFFTKNEISKNGNFASHVYKIKNLWFPIIIKSGLAEKIIFLLNDLNLRNSYLNDLVEAESDEVID